VVKDFLLEMGLRLPDVVAAFFGGLASVFFVKSVTPWQAVSTFVVGIVLGTYLGSPAARTFGIATETASCLVAFAGMAIAQGIIEAAKNWRPRIPGGDK